MKISTKENASGRISGYYVDGQKVRKCEIETLACNSNEIIEIDYYTAKNFPLIEKPNENMKVVFTGYYGGQKLMTKAAAAELAMTIGRLHSRNVYYVTDEIGEVTETPDTVENETADDEVKDDDSKLAELFEDREVKRRAALHSSFDSDESKAARDANKAVEEFIGKVAKDLRDKAPVGLSVVDSWDSADLDAPKFVVIELATDKRTCYSKIAEVKAALTVTKTVTVEAENVGNLTDSALAASNSRLTAFNTPEENVEKLFDAYEAQNSVAHISENGYIAAVNFQPQNTVHWHCKIRRYQNLDEAIDAVRYVNEHDTFTVTRGGRVEIEYGKRNERTREYFARNLYGVEYFKEAYFDELVDQYAVTVDAFNFAVEYEIEEAEYAAYVERSRARMLADDNLAARYEKAKSQVKCERYENGYCGWYFKGKHSDKWEHDETKAAACLTRYGLSRFEFSVLSEDETAVINSNGYDESAFDLLPTVDELNDCRSDIEKEFDEFAAEYTDRDARFNHGERHAAKLEKKLRELDPTVEVTYDIDEDGEDVFYLRFGKYVYRTPFATLDAVEETFHLWREDDQVNNEFDKAVAESVNEYSATVEINGETLTFEDGQLSEIGSTRYGAYFKIRDGRKIFYYRGNRVSKQDFFGHIAVEDKAISERAAITEFVAKYGGSEFKPGTNPHGNFVAQIHPTLANGRQDNYEVTFDDKAAAYAFIDEFKTLAGDMKFLATIKRGSFYGEQIYRHGLNGQEFFAPDDEGDANEKARLG